MNETAHPPRILITGANGSIGHAMARYFLEHERSCGVFLGVHQRRERADALAAEFPERATVIPLDVTSPEAWTNALSEIEGLAGPLSVLVNCAGFHDDALLSLMSLTQWTEVLDGNLRSVFLGCQAVLNGMMRERSGRIINVSSLSALHPPAGQTNYAAAKAGVIALTQSLAKETARMGITVNAVCPGYVEGGLPANWTEEERKVLQKQIPMRRFAKPEEIAAAVFFLASPEASYITGAALKMDGGLT